MTDDLEFGMVTASDAALELQKQIVDLLNASQTAVGGVQMMYGCLAVVAGRVTGAIIESGTPNDQVLKVFFGNFNQGIREATASSSQGKEARIH